MKILQYIYSPNLPQAGTFFFFSKLFQIEGVHSYQVLLIDLFTSFFSYTCAKNVEDKLFSTFVSKFFYKNG